MISFSYILISNSQAQPTLDTKIPVEVLNIDSKTLSNVSNTKDSLDKEVLTKEHKEQIESAVKHTTYGHTIWTYFGEIILLGITTLLIYIRVTIKQFFTTIFEKIKSKEKKKNIYTNKDIELLGKLSEDINVYLTKIKEMTKSKRVLLYQFSNGTHFFSSIPVLRMTVTNYSEGDNVKQTDNVFNYVTAKEIVHQILNDEYLEIEDTNTINKYCGYVSYLRFAKFKNSTLVRVNVSDNYCGVIELIEPTVFKLEEVRSYCYSIGHLFEKYNREKECSV